MRVLKKVAVIVLVLFLCVSSSTVAFGLGLSDIKSNVIKDVPSDMYTINGIGDPNPDDPYYNFVTIANKYISMDATGHFYLSDMTGLYNSLKKSVADQMVKSVDEVNELVNSLSSDGEYRVVTRNKVVYCYVEGFDSPCAVLYWCRYELYINPSTHYDATTTIETKDYFSSIYDIPLI